MSERSKNIVKLALDKATISSSGNIGFTGAQKSSTEDEMDPNTFQPKLTELTNVPMESATIEDELGFSDAQISCNEEKVDPNTFQPKLTELTNVPMESDTNEDEIYSTASLSELDPYLDDSDSDYIPQENAKNRRLVNYLIPSEDNTDDTLSGDETESNTVAEQEVGLKKTRKRKRKLTVWKRNAAKKLRNLGKSYTNSKNNTVPERKLKEPCRNICRLKCNSKISKDMRLSIFSEYWALGDVNRQRDFILRFVDFKNKSRQRLRRLQVAQTTADSNDEDYSNLDTNSRRKMTYFYHLSSDEGEREKVCQMFFLNTLGISHQVVKTVAAKHTSDNNVITIDKDNRGKHPAKSRLTDTQELLVKQHINSFEAVESHYVRKDSSKKYLPGSLNISKMFRLYVDYCKENAVDKKDVVRESMYRWIFVNKFNIGFHILKKDQCDLCVNYQNSNDSEKLKLHDQFETHLLNKNSMRKKKEDDKLKACVDNSFCLAIFDLQQVLQCPKIEVGQAYYKSKIATYNLTVYEVAKKQGYCYMWHEAIVSRGTCERGSCILKFIEAKVKEGFKTISFFSDNCGGQNKNKFMYITLLYAAIKFGLKISLSFMEVGHTQNEGDSMHSAIERCARRIPVYTPGQWATIARTACIKKPYFVIEMNQTDFFDLKDLQLKCTKKMEKTTSGDIVKWSDISCVKVDFEYPNILKFAYKLQNDFFEIDVIEGLRKQPLRFSEYTLKPIRNNLIPISKIKYDSIIYYCQKNAVAKEYEDFFLCLPH